MTKEESFLLDPELGCPKCGERDMRKLVFRDNENIIDCQNCGHFFGGDDWAKEKSDDDSSKS